MHIIPFTAFEGIPKVSVSQIAKSPILFPPVARHAPTHWQVNFDGFLTTSNTPENPQRSYVQIFRNGIIETVDSSVLLEPTDSITTQTLSAILIQSTFRLIPPIASLGADPPYAVFGSLVGAKAKTLLPNFPQYLYGQSGITSDQDQLHFAEAIVEATPKTYEDAARAMRGTLDHIANAAGLNVSPCFDQTDRYTFAF